MRLQSTEVRDALAAEYVLGTLRGPARDRFERFLRDDEDLRELVVFWEALLDRFNAGIEPVSAPSRLWAAVEKRLGFISDKPGPQQRQPVAAPLRWWRGAWVGFAVAALLVVTLVFSPEPTPDPFNPTLQVVLQNQQAKPVWEVKADTQHNMLMISALRPINLPSDRDLELWLLPKSGEAPVSLGLMPTEMANKRLVTSQTPLAEGAALAVSLEPTGGSPTGAPTGPVLYVQNYEIRG